MDSVVSQSKEENILNLKKKNLQNNLHLHLLKKSTSKWGQSGPGPFNPLF